MGCHPAASCRIAGLSRRCNGIHRYSVHGGGANVWLRIGCWGDDSAGSLRCKPFVCAHRSTPSQYGSGRVAALTSYSQVGCGNGRCIGHRPQLCEGLIIHRSRNRQDFKTCMGGVDARVSAGAFAGIRTRTGQFLRLSPLPVGLRKRCASNPQGYARAVHDRSGRLCRIPAPMPAVDARTAAWGMTGITGRGAHAPPKPFPHPVVRLTRDTVAHVSGNLVRTRRIGFIGFTPIPPTGDCSHRPLIG